jgi:hypothetical protein
MIRQLLGQPLGIATLDEDGKVPTEQLPSGTGGGDNISVNGVAATDADFDNTTPAAPANSLNVIWQKDTATPNNISASVPATTTPTASKIPIADSGGKVDGWVSDGSTTVKGKVELATDGETGAGVVVQGNDARLSNARTPTSHASSHMSAGADPVRLDELKVPTDITTLNATTVQHGLLPKLGGGSTNYLRADGTWSAPPSGSDPWVYVKVVGSDFSTTSATAVDVTGLAFTPAANTDYEFEALLMIRTATASVNPRAGLAWPTGMTDGVAQIMESQAVTGTPLFAFGNVNAALLIAVGALPNTTQSWPVSIKGMIRAGATPSGTVRVQLASETAGTAVKMMIGSFLRYRII